MASAPHFIEQNNDMKKAQKDNILCLLDSPEGLSYTEIAAICKTKEAVVKAVHDQVIRRRQAHARTEAEVSVVVERLNAGETLVQIARQMGLTPRTLLDRAKRVEVVLPIDANGMGTRTLGPDTRDEEIKDLRERLMAANDELSVLRARLKGPWLRATTVPREARGRTCTFSIHQDEIDFDLRLVVKLTPGPGERAQADIRHQSVPLSLSLDSYEAMMFHLLPDSKKGV